MGGGGGSTERKFGRERGFTQMALAVSAGDLLDRLEVKKHEEVFHKREDIFEKRRGGSLFIYFLGYL